MMTLSEKQRQFTKMVALLIEWAYGHGYELTLGEAYRAAEPTKCNAEIGIGITNNPHSQRLALDLNLFIKGKYQIQIEAYLPLGEYWESLGGYWGGRFKPHPDINHFSLEYNGVC